ncbi:MAG TPA: LCP family protein [Acidimicrobiales bacterium]|nr:LCP family protein [Acidimicrobiales bacterium]
MTSGPQMDVKGQRKPRGRRRFTAEAPAREAPTAPAAAPPVAEEPGEEAPAPEAGSPADPAEDEPDVLARQKREIQPLSSPNSSAGASRRDRLARERAAEAEEIEAAALAGRTKPSRRERRAEKRGRRKGAEESPLAATPPDAGAPRVEHEPVGMPRVAAPRAAAPRAGAAHAGATDTAAVAPQAVATPATEPAEGAVADAGAPDGATADAEPEDAADEAPAAAVADAQEAAPFAPSRPPPRRTPPRPPTAPPGRPPSARSAARAKVLRQRRRRRRTIIGTTVLLTVVNLLVGGGYAYFQWRLDQISRLDVPGLTDDVPGEVMNVLLVGSDSRERLTGEAAAQAGKDQVEGQRSDTIMVLHVDPRQRRAAILSIPRDLYIPIAGTNQSDRVNTAFATGGPDRLISTLTNLGIQVNHYAEVDFVGFKEIVDAVGGVTVFLSHWARDFTSGLDVPRTGCVDLDGTQALAYVRSRNFERLIDGKWVADPRGDLGRIERQQDFVRKVMKKAVRTGITNPITLNRLIGIGVRNLTVDATMSTSDITNVARRFRSVNPDSVETLVLPTTPQRIEGQDVLVLKQDEARDEIAKINGLMPVGGPPTTPPAAPTPTRAPDRPPTDLSDVRLQVLNGNGARGAAGIAGEALKAAGFTVAGTGDAATAPRTLVRYRPGQQVPAQIIQNGLETGAQLREDATLRNIDVVLVLGTDYKGFKPAPAPGAGATSPQAPPTTDEPPC